MDTRNYDKALNEITELLGQMRHQTYEAGYKAGYREAMARMRNLMQLLPKPRLGHGPEAAPLPDSGNPKSGYVNRALKYLREHPGSTAWEARDQISKSSFYRLAKRGLARRHGSRFYPVDQ